MLGLSAAVGGTWVERTGPRKAMFVAGCCWAAGFVVSAVGVATGQLWLVYLGYGVIGGIGLGIGYISPVSTLIKWFPDRPGLATGLAIMGFGAARSSPRRCPTRCSTRQAAPMIQDHIDTVSAAAAAGFVGLLSLCNMSGRLVWSSTSDLIGRKRIYMVYLGVGAILYFLLASNGTASVAFFVLLTGVILPFYGGGFATVPAYLKDLFGTMQVGAIHGRLLTACSAAGIAGPLIVNGIADSETAAGKEGADIYTLSLYLMAGVLVVGFIANLLIRPVSGRFLEEESEAAEPRFSKERARERRPAVAGQEG